MPGYRYVLDIPIALAVGAGMVATVNPCGFAMLPAYLGFFVGTDDAGRGDRMARAFLVSAAMTAGFVTVFGVVGILVQTVAQGIDEHLSKVTLAVGLILVGLGVWLLSGRELRISAPRVERGGSERTFVSMYLFGVSYATASLSCTLGPFLVALTPTFRASGTLAGLAAFVSYALGMGLVVGVVTVAVAGAQGGLVSWMRRVGPLVSRASGALLVLAGAYVAWYGWWELRGDFGADPVVDRAQSVREWLVARVESLPRGMTAAVLLALVVVVVLRARRLRAGDGAGDGNAGGPDRVPEVSSHSEASHT